MAIEEAKRIGGWHGGSITVRRERCRRLQDGLASFDKLRMRSFLSGTTEIPFSTFLILSLSKDAPADL